MKKLWVIHQQSLKVILQKQKTSHIATTFGKEVSEITYLTFCMEKYLLQCALTTCRRRAAKCLIKTLLYPH